MISHAVCRYPCPILLAIFLAVGCGASLGNARRESPVSSASAEESAERDRFFQDQLQRADVPGLAVAAIRKGELIWTNGYGLADVDKKLRVTADTVFYSASI